MKKNRDSYTTIVVIVVILALFFLNLVSGEASLTTRDVLSILMGNEAENSSWSFIVEGRLYRSITAIFAGGALALSGVILQVFFRNPLAGPGVLGITSGASLGIAVVILGGVSVGSFLGTLGLISAGVLGALAILFILLIIARFIRNSITLLVAGLMFGYFSSALINIFYLWASETATRKYVIWGLGSFEGLSTSDLVILMSVVLVMVITAIPLVKALNAYVLGPDYASSIGVNIKKTRFLIIIITGVLAAIVTVYCGPISFIGIAVPQLVRYFIQSKNHVIILPITFLCGSLLALMADVVVRQSGNLLPLNTVTALIGAPVIVWVIINLNQRNAQF